MTITDRTVARRLATVETITSLRPIPGANSIECARIRGWDVVTRIGQFEVGDQCVYFEVDSLLDVADPRFEFLARAGVRTDSGGRRGHVLRTARLRGQYSQGLALPFGAFPELAAYAVGDDVTDALGVIKWDPPIPANLAGKIRGMRPTWIPVTDEDRVQNYPGILDGTGGLVWIATEKIDGASMTAYVDPATETAGVCTRNLDLLPEAGNTLWGLATEHNLHTRIAATWPGRRVAVQGEAYGNGIQDNPLKIKGHAFAAFTLLVDDHEIGMGDWPDWLTALAVPTLDLPFPRTVKEALAQAERLHSTIADWPAEGIVWRTAAVPSRRRESFKVISNRYLWRSES